MNQRRRVIKFIGAIGGAASLFPQAFAQTPLHMKESATIGGFEGKGDDDTERLQSAFDWLAQSRGRSLKFEAKTYVTSRRITLTRAASFSIDGAGAKIIAADNMPVAADYQILSLDSCEDGEIQNLRVDGNRSRRHPAEVPAHSVQILNACARLSFRKVASDNAVVDGFYVATARPREISAVPTDISFYSCSSENAFRNGLSVIDSVRFRDYDGRYTGANGTLPMCGVDFEPNSATDVGNVDAQCFRTESSNNSGTGFQVARRNSAVQLHDVIARNNTTGAVNGGWGRLEIDGIVLSGYKASVRRGIIDASYGSGETRITRVTASNCNTGSISKPLIYVHQSNNGPVIIDQVRIRSSTIQAAGGKPQQIMHLDQIP